MGQALAKGQAASEGGDGKVRSSIRSLKHLLHEADIYGLKDRLADAQVHTLDGAVALLELSDDDRKEILVSVVGLTGEEYAALVEALRQHVHASQLFQLQVETPDGKQVMIQVKLGDRILAVKHLLAPNVSIPAEEQDLRCEGRQLVDEETVEASNIAGKQITLAMGPAKPAQILIHNSASSDTVAVRFSPSLSLAELRQQVHAAVGIEPRRQRLVYNGRRLKGTRTLESWGVKAGDTILLKLRPTPPSASWADQPSRAKPAKPPAHRATKPRPEQARASLRRSDSDEPYDYPDIPEVPMEGGFAGARGGYSAGAAMKAGVAESATEEAAVAETEDEVGDAAAMAPAAVRESVHAAELESSSDDSSWGESDDDEPAFNAARSPPYIQYGGGRRRSRESRDKPMRDMPTADVSENLTRRTALLPGVGSAPPPGAELGDEDFVLESEQDEALQAAIRASLGLPPPEPEAADLGLESDSSGFVSVVVEDSETVDSDDYPVPTSSAVGARFSPYASKYAVAARRRPEADDGDGEQLDAGRVSGTVERGAVAPEGETRAVSGSKKGEEQQVSSDHSDDEKETGPGILGDVEEEEGEEEGYSAGFAPVRSPPLRGRRNRSRVGAEAPSGELASSDVPKRSRGSVTDKYLAAMRGAESAGGALASSDAQTGSSDLAEAEDEAAITPSVLVPRPKPAASTSRMDAIRLSYAEALKIRSGLQDKPEKPKVAHSPERSPAFDLEGKHATPEAAQRQAVAAMPSSSKEADYDAFLPVQVPAAAAAGDDSVPTPEAPVSSGLLQPALSISDFVASRGLYGSLGSEATQAASGKEQEPVPFVRRLLSSSTGSEGILPPQPRKVAQGPAAKPSAVARERSVADWSASRYFPSSRPVEDDVNFSVYAPSAIAQGGAAPLDVWAFVRAQEAAVRERATAKGSTQRGTASRLLRVGRGDLVTVLLRVDGSPFETADEREEGGGCRRTFTWVGSRPCTVRFWVKARRAAPVGAHPVCIRIIVGTQVLDVDAFLTVSSQKGVAAAAALAAASLVRAHRAQERLMKSGGKDGCAFQLSQFRELAARGRFVVPAFGDAEQTMHDVGVSAASQALGQESVSLDTVTPAGPVESSWLKTHMSLVDACLVEVRWEDLQHERTLGAGAHGEAWLASVSGDSARVLAGVPEYRNLLAADGTAKVVVKSPKIPPSSGGDHVVRGFKHEVAVASFLGHHPNIVMQVGACTEEGPQRLAMCLEVCEGGSADQRLQAAVHAKGLAASASGPAPPPNHRERLGWCRDVATGLANMHSNNILHCDVATRNVLLTASGQAKLCDLGLARHLGAVDAIDLDSYGPWRLMAPEVLQSPAIFSRASDVYGFGTFMWEVFSSTRKTPEGYTGQVLPWTGLKRDTRVAMMLQVCSEHGQRVRLEPSHNWVSPALAQLQQRCVSFSYATALPPVDVSLDDGWSSLELPPSGAQKRTTNSGIAFHTAFRGSQCDTHIRPSMAHVAGLLDSMLGQVPVDS